MVESAGSTSRCFPGCSVTVLYWPLKPISDCFWQVPLMGEQTKRSKEPERKQEHNSCILAKDGLSLKTVAIISHSSPCGFLYHCGSCQKKKKSKNGIKLLHAKVSDLGKEETRSPCASESHFWPDRDVIRSKSKRSSRLHQGLREQFYFMGSLGKNP